MKLSSTYLLGNFIGACAADPTKAYLKKDALITASTDFSLNTQQRVLDFISNGGLENPSFINTSPWKKNPAPENKIMVDAYGFFTGITYGYIAFYFQETTDKWIVKSFKKNTGTDPRNFSIQYALEAIRR